jgi:hypothetical protein
MTAPLAFASTLAEFFVSPLGFPAHRRMSLVSGSDGGHFLF